MLPAGALDDAQPDEQRLTEATGNEGASFERSYHRAALVIWPMEGFADVLLQAGVGAALPYLADQVQMCEGSPEPELARERVIATAERIIAAWEATPGYRTYAGRSRRPNRDEMLDLLGTIADPALIEWFIDGVVIRDFDGSENQALVRQEHLLGAENGSYLLSRIAHENTRRSLGACVDLLSRLVRANDQKGDVKRTSALCGMAEAIVERLPEVGSRGSSPGVDWRVREAQPLDAAMVADLLDSLATLGTRSLRDRSAEAVAANTRAFDPGELIVPTLDVLRTRRGASAQNDSDFQLLWHHSAEFLLARGEFPPDPPADWRQEVTIGCLCEDCRELQAFASDPRKESYRFRVRKDRRQHLHETIKRYQLDMSHVTERKGSPQTLVCQKTFRIFERHCEQWSKDIAALERLSEVVDVGLDGFAAPRERIAAASARAPQRFSPP